ncbi:SprT-like domain-containing protein [Planctomycetota bacterium]
MEIFEAILQGKLKHKIGKPVDLTITDNVSSMIYIRKNDKGFTIRLHHMFIDADNRLLDDIACYANTGKSKLIQKFIDEHSFLIRNPAEKREPRISTIGEHHNLLSLFNTLNERYFRSKASCAITWGRRRRHKGRRSIQLGSYNSNLDLIRINPRLDSPRVPLYFIEYIVFHEMLHSILNPASKASHTKEFRDKEKAFKQYHQAATWQKKHINMFIR